VVPPIRGPGEIAVSAVQETPQGKAAEFRLPEVESTVFSEFPFEFTGNATEYFRIWIVNFALSIVTLGIYSAWSKVRTQRYFYSNTYVAGAPFEYLAKPIPILKGRIVAFVLFGAYILSAQISVRIQLSLLALIFLVAPWLIVRGLRFRSRYSAWRSLNFSFAGGYGKAYVNYLLLLVFVPLSIGLYQPFLKARQKRFVVDNTRYGTAAFDFKALNGDFFPPYLKAFGLIILWYIVAAAMMFFIFRAFGMHLRHVQAPLYFVFAVMYAGFFAIAVYLTTRINNLVYNNVELAGNRLRSELRARDMIGIYASNTLAILCTAGMLAPWAMVRLARYRASRMMLISAGNLDTFTASRSHDESAAASEVDTLFDIDIGF
jgi:uncharacterized membrane protein YjgN (DUF898 family)